MKLTSYIVLFGIIASSSSLSLKNVREVSKNTLGRRFIPPQLFDQLASAKAFFRRKYQVDSNGGEVLSKRFDQMFMDALNGRIPGVNYRRGKEGDKSLSKRFDQMFMDAVNGRIPGVNYRRGKEGDESLSKRFDQMFMDAVNGRIPGVNYR
ncbi:hypothetical protein K502DRAFT_349043 [Neoconidiobolus thromboides FSU 785]|nr:hypothetical protein K502DRAFT_349043 [Neoconidiobolus thromboides FSU 785]